MADSCSTVRDRYLRPASEILDVGGGPDRYAIHLIDPHPALREETGRREKRSIVVNRVLVIGNGGAGTSTFSVP